MNGVNFSISHHNSYGDGRYALPQLTETAELIERILLWPPPTRTAAIGLWQRETGLTLSECWDVAGLLIDGEVAA